MNVFQHECFFFHDEETVFWFSLLLKMTVGVDF